MWGEAIERMPADGRKHPERGVATGIDYGTRDEAIEFYKSKLEQMEKLIDETDEKMSKLSDEKVKLERGIINLIKLLGD